MKTLTGPVRPAQSRVADSLLVFLHGYGADGADLIGLAEPLAPHLPNTRFAAPDAPDPCRSNPGGRQWFPIPWLDGSSEAETGLALAASHARLDAWLDAEAAGGMAPARTVLLGFSQGTMLALHAGLRRRTALAGIVGFSGRLLLPGRLGAEIVSKPPVLLLHGDADPVVPFAHLAEAAAALKAADVEIRTFAAPGIGHGIAPEGLGLAVEFIKERLGTAV